MNRISAFAYAMLAPLLRNVLRDRITGKPIVDSSMRLFYNRGQHLGFLGRRQIDYEPETRHLLLNVVKPGQLVFEIGSNIGQFSLLLAERLGPTGRLVCVEPDPENLAYLHFNIRKNFCRNVDILAWAISDKAGKAEFYRDRVTGGRSGSLMKQYAQGIEDQAPVIVETRTYRELVRQYGQPDVVKVDVEGAEDRVFPDPSVLHDAGTYLVEVRHDTKATIFKLFTGAGFEARVAGLAGGPVMRADQVPDFCNLLFTMKTG
jgi:FkbM family methyltransferase